MEIEVTKWRAMNDGNLVDDEQGNTKWVGHVGFPDDSMYHEFQEKSVKAISQQDNAERFSADDVPF